MEFESLPIPDVVLQGIRDADFKYCTPIQAKTLPLSLEGNDVAGQAQTGTGKTAAFLISTFTRLVNHPPPEQKGKRWVAPRALIIAPTRELALQIERDALLLGKHCQQKILCVYGGVDYEKQRQKIKEGVDVLIATPGRLIDYYKQRFFSMKSVEVVVIDEADRLFDMGFIQDVRYIMRNISPYHKRQSMLFSATLNFRVMELCYEHMNDPIPVKIEPEKIVVDQVKQVLYHVGKHEKFNLLLGLLKSETPGKTLIFTNMKSTAEKLEAQLKYNDYEARQISGDLHQKKRIKVLQQFTEGDIDILIATDVASRGLHIDDITHVINYDVPQDPEDYVHRIGRTARA
ncbi:MAG: DEAD/DEAH box helicase, partial [Nitrospinaceae bacterium]|nr:DEAD/DEAH box helicase [Nitrospinaceae bacterium]NIR53457.1 DEAD/DEAH box helicase [Nitrospinaceae bacterium]NIS83860.1 DEAD/DEAH box helicase [Nitrospinaceae bacterium]NIT80651.1 DEAD/DEAH box helicase [Nitrospinaceae bacterium]NIU42979.1 DEAD/DEAH box helicase [Nitrospinaceae bacterium]